MASFLRLIGLIKLSLIDVCKKKMINPIKRRNEAIFWVESLVWKIRLTLTSTLQKSDLKNAIEMK